MNTLIDPAKRIIEPTVAKAGGLGVKVYLKSGAVIHLSGMDQPRGNDNTKPGWSVSGYRFVLHGPAVMTGALANDEKIEF